MHALVMFVAIMSPMMLMVMGMIEGGIGMLMTVVPMVNLAEEVGFNFEDAAKIESILSQHRVKRYRTTLGLVKLCIRIDCPDARLHLGQFRSGDEIGLVQENDIGKGNL